MDKRIKAAVFSHVQDALHGAPFTAKKSPDKIRFSRSTPYGSQAAVLECDDFGKTINVCWSFEVEIDEVNSIHEKYLPTEYATLIVGAHGFRGHLIESAKDVALASRRLVSEFNNLGVPFFESHQSVNELDGIVNRSRKKALTYCDLCGGLRAGRVREVGRRPAA